MDLLEPGEAGMDPISETGSTHHSFLRGCSALRSNPLPIYIPFLSEKVPFSYTFF